MSFNMNQVVLWVVWLTVIVAVVVAECPSGYTQRHGGNCYKVTNYKLESWFYADRSCRAEGAFLASIRSKAEADWVNVLYGKHRGGHCGDWYWIGVNDIDQEGRWEYEESGERAWYGNWYPGEPNNNWNEDVVEVNYHTKKWNDHQIMADAACYVCEMYQRSY